MKLTRASTYALHALAYMAAQKSDRPIASHKIAADRHIPERFLLKVLKPLVQAQVLRSIKGPNGGYKLAKPPSEITLLEVLEAAEGGPIRGSAPVIENGNGPLHGKLETICKQTADLTRKHLEKIHISDLLGGKK
jgi:Rrf2 family protein